MTSDFAEDIAAVGGIDAVPTILDIVCRVTGMRFAAVARVTEDRWIACRVKDDIAFGLVPGGELDVRSTICHDIRQTGDAVFIDHVAEDNDYCTHHTPKQYGFQSYASMPIRLRDGTFFGTLCAIDPLPRELKNAETMQMFKMFADVIGYHLSAVDQINKAQIALSDEQEASALREQFIAVLGHDLRNPLAALSGGLRLLQKTPLNERAQSIIVMMQGSAQRMAGLLDNVMDFARGRLGGGITIELATEVSLEAVLAEVLAEFRGNMPDRTIMAQFDISRPIVCDRRRIGQLVSNLVGNALAYGAPERPVRVTARSDERAFELSVANEGPPIPQAIAAQIFEPFSRGTLKASREGLGLGLYIASEIAKGHGGTLDVVSTPAETRFTFRLPLRARDDLH